MIREIVTRSQLMELTCVSLAMGDKLFLAKYKYSRCQVTCTLPAVFARPKCRAFVVSRNFDKFTTAQACLLLRGTYYCTKLLVSLPHSTSVSVHVCLCVCMCVSHYIYLHFIVVLLCLLATQRGSLLHATCISLSLPYTHIHRASCYFSTM